MPVSVLYAIFISHQVSSLKKLKNKLKNGDLNVHSKNEIDHTNMNMLHDIWHINVNTTEHMNC